MNKKLLMWGIPILAIALVSAVVYVYVSNTATVDVTINAPMQVYLNGDESKTSLSLQLHRIASRNLRLFSIEISLCGRPLLL